MKIAFAGTPHFAVPALNALLAAQHDVVTVWTQPDRPAGRGLKTVVGPVAAVALAHHLPLRQCVKWDNAEEEVLRQLHVDVMVVAAYGLLFPKSALAIPKMGGLNIHASLLPRWRGAAPVLRAIQAGDEKTGVSLMAMEHTLDTGPVFAVAEEQILPMDTQGTLMSRLAHLGATLLVTTLPKLPSLVPTPQDSVGAVYAKKLMKDEAILAWDLPALTLERWVRALQPTPGARTFLRNQGVKIHRAQALVSDGAKQTPGTVISAHDEGIDVATGQGILRVLDIQPAGKRAMPVSAFLAGHTIAPGMVFSTAPLAT